MPFVNAWMMLELNLRNLRDVMDKVKAELEKRATGLGRVFEPKEKAKRKVQKAFYFGNAETRFKNPYKQAEYLYGLIEGVQMNG